MELTNAIEIRGLTKHYKGFSLENLNLDLPAGCVLGLVGENGAGKSTTIRLTMDALERVGLSGRVKHRPTEMSGGQQQRVAIARAIATRPPIIMADEPTGALDSRTGHEVLEFLQQLNREGTTVILITHDNGIAATARRVARLADGKIIEDCEQEVDWL